LSGAPRFRENALVALGDKPYSPAFEPVAYVSVAEFPEEALHQTETPRIDGFDTADLSKRIGEIAAATSCNRDFCQQFRACLIDSYVQVRIHFLHIHGRETTCRPAAYHSHFLSVFSHHFVINARI
jgi:hypothetical protein